MHGKYWYLKYRDVSIHIQQNYFPDIGFKYNGWFTKYLIIDINKFPEEIRTTLSPEFYEQNSNIINDLYWTYGGITYYKIYHPGFIKVGSDYGHFEHHMEFKRYDLKLVKKDAEKCVDSLLVLQAKNEQIHHYVQLMDNNENKTTTNI